MDEQMNENEQATASDPAEVPAVELAERPQVPFGAELHTEQLPDDRDKLSADLAAHDARLGALADDDDEEAQDERSAARQAAGLAQSGIAEPFTREPWVHRDEHGAPIATLVNFTCNRKGCVHASLDKRHAWMHAAGHVARGQ